MALAAAAVTFYWVGRLHARRTMARQTPRRGDELHILNEIGRALGSTLELDLLLERIYAEMRRLVEVSSFVIASHDTKADQIRFEIEVTEGERLPRRSRPAGNHLLEYVLRTRQPLLIRERFGEETQRLGIEPLRQVGSMCAVPLVLYDRAVGVMMVHSPKEGVFDEGHQELLRVLANEASIAIENARLFTEEQKKSRHLTLINNVSGHAITTLNPVEMLEKIATEIETSLAYDHIGIATLDYSTKELVVQAEAGARKAARGRRIEIGEGIVGQVGRSGQMAMVREANALTPKMVLAGSVASIALPVIYAEQLLGVLYVESPKPCEFPEQEILLLRTLADLFAGALHNALTFQKAQEQAITDGLTGVKTHRFLMEALSAEWKRSTRANRPFALVLMDLDRFKFVNDFYGHLEGDVILRRVGHILEQNCRRSDVVARYGGDEFVILMPETSLEQAGQLANKLRAWVASDPLLRDKNVTASFGIAGIPDSRINAAGIDPGGGLLDVSLEAPGREFRFERRAGRPQRRQAMEEGCAGSVPRRDAQAIVFNGSAGIRRDLPAAGAFHAFAGGPGTGRFRKGAAAGGGRDRHFAGAGDRCEGSIHARAFAEGFGIRGDARAGAEPGAGGGGRDPAGRAAARYRKGGHPGGNLEQVGAARCHRVGNDEDAHRTGREDSRAAGDDDAHTTNGRHHHEYYDGSGYPDRLQGEAIPYGSRVIAIADSYDTITSERSYKKGRSPEEASRSWSAAPPPSSIRQSCAYSSKRCAAFQTLKLALRNSRCRQGVNLIPLF